MQKLESLLAERKTAIAVDFDHLKHHVRCYAHIINICSSHVISSMTSVFKPYISKLKVPVDSNFIFCGDSEDELDDDDDNTGCNIDNLELDCYDDEGKSNLKHWFAGIKHNPLRHAHRVIRLLRSSDQCRENFHMFI
jgi:hypothetical protein